MPNTDDAANFLFKRALRVGETNVDTQFFSEPYPSNVPVYPTQIWADRALMPPTAPILPPDGIDGSGTVQYKEKLALVAAPSGQAFYHIDLINAIPFNFDPAGSYNYVLYQNNGTTVIPFGLDDWVVDNASGILTFYGGVPGGMPPKISFYRYVGTLGLTSSGGTDANGITITTDGPGGTNPVNKGNAATTNVYYVREENGLTLLAGPEPPGGLSGIAPYGAVDNDANTTTVLKKIITIGNATEPVISFPSDAVAIQSYSIIVRSHGTSTAGLSIGKVIQKETRYACCYPDDPVDSITVSLENISGSSLTMTKTPTSYDLTVTGITGYTITWIVTIIYSQYRVA